MGGQGRLSEVTSEPRLDCREVVSQVQETANAKVVGVFKKHKAW